MRYKTAVLTAAPGLPQRLAIDYVVHYIKASGAASPKVFKWTEKDPPGGESLTLTKRQTIRDFTTRRHYPGRSKSRSARDRIAGRNNQACRGLRKSAICNRHAIPAP